MIVPHHDRDGGRARAPGGAAVVGAPPGAPRSEASTCSQSTVVTVRPLTCSPVGVAPGGRVPCRAAAAGCASRGGTPFPNRSIPVSLVGQMEPPPTWRWTTGPNESERRLWRMGKSWSRGISGIHRVIHRIPRRSTAPAGFTHRSSTRRPHVVHVSPRIVGSRGGWLTEVPTAG